MYDLQICLFYSYIIYGFFLPIIFVFLLVVHKNISSFLIPIIIIDTILYLILLATLFQLRNKDKRFWWYIILIVTIGFISIRNLYLFIAIIYRTMTEFEKKEAIFSDAIHRQINFDKEPQHPVWKIILLKQCCGLVGKYSDAKTAEYQWFQKTSFSYFCPGLHLNDDQIIKFEQRFQMKYSPQGSCLTLINNELKIELILISISLGFSILLMLLTWLFIWQDRLIYIELLKNMLQKQKENSIIPTNKSSITTIMEEPVKVEIPPASVVDHLEQSNEIVTPSPSETKRLYQGYLTALEDVQ